MDYEKRYKEACKLLRELYPIMNDYTKKKIDDIVPELKESEDERIKNEIIAFVEQSIHRGGGTPIPEEQETKWIVWLEKKQGEQKPAEWSKEDEAFYQRLEQIVCKVDIEAFQGDIDLHSWLKSHKPKNRWKPSDEQMEALHDLNLIGGISYTGQGQTLIELYNDLKKLIEE